MEHVFGKPEGGVPELGARFCNEPLIPNVLFDKIYHAHYEILSNGNFRCTHCDEHFIEVDV